MAKLTVFQRSQLKQIKKLSEKLLPILAQMEVLVERLEKSESEFEVIEPLSYGLIKIQLDRTELIEKIDKIIYG